jgi:2-oxoglutarate dehydrogenase E2 component (dihydrolipoamide succinyltransferase)
MHQNLLCGLFLAMRAWTRLQPDRSSQKSRACQGRMFAALSSGVSRISMSLEVKIPAVGESITSGLLSTWHKNDGDAVNVGDVLLTLETDKVSTEIAAEKAGLLKIKVPAGQEVKIGEVVATIEDSPGAKKKAGSAVPEAPAKPVVPLVSPASVAPAHTMKAKPVPPEKPVERVSISEPRSAAAPAGPATVATGPVREEASAPAGEPIAPARDGRITRKKLSPLRRKIAAQLVMAQQTAAILTTFNECDMSAVMKLRAEMQETFTKAHGTKLGFMSFFIKATVSALKSVPTVNGRMDGEDFVQNHYYDIGVAVGTERGLIVPVIRDADRKSFAQIERDLAEYAVKAREGKIKIEELQGGVFTISNGGVYGSLLSTPILNPPQSGILGMHKIQERPVALEGAVALRPMMYLALSYDHRVVDGKEAVTFLVRVKDCIENPARLLLEL